MPRFFIHSTGDLHDGDSASQCTTMTGQRAYLRTRSGVRSQHPSVKNRMAAPAYKDKAGLDAICPMQDLFRRVSNGDISFEFNLLLLWRVRESEQSCVS